MRIGARAEDAGIDGQSRPSRFRTAPCAGSPRSWLPSRPERALRVSVEGGGCSGFQYRYDLVRDPPAADDVVLARDGATVLIDTMSLDYMGGSEIDFVDDLIGQSFQIKNPHAVAACGCGTSFSV